MSNIESKGPQMGMYIPNDVLSKIYSDGRKYLAQNKHVFNTEEAEKVGLIAYVDAATTEYHRAHSSHPIGQLLSELKEYRAFLQSIRTVANIGVIRHEARQLIERYPEPPLQPIKEPVVEMEKKRPDVKAKYKEWLKDTGLDRDSLPALHALNFAAFLFADTDSPSSIQQEAIPEAWIEKATIAASMAYPESGMHKDGDKKTRAHQRAFVDGVKWLLKKVLIPDQPSNESDIACVLRCRIKAMQSELSALREEKSDLEGKMAGYKKTYTIMLEDVREASEELMIDVPEPGTDMAKVMRANAIMRRQRDSENNRASELGELLATEKAEKEEYRKALREIYNGESSKHHTYEDRLGPKDMAIIAMRVLDKYPLSPASTPPIKPDPPYVLRSDGPASTVLADALDHLYDGFNISMLGEHEPRIRRLLNELVEGLRRVDQKDRRRAIDFSEWVADRGWLLHTDAPEDEERAWYKPSGSFDIPDDSMSGGQLYDLYLQSLTHKQE